MEAYATSDQTNETIARLLVDQVVCRHGVPGALLSDRGANLLSELIRDVCSLLGMQKINTTAYHPQCDGLAENFNRTLQGMLAKHAKAFGPNWDLHLHQFLFAYRTKPHSSTGELPFYLVYDRDPRCPTGTAFSRPWSKYAVDVDDYAGELSRSLQVAWQLARKNISKARKHQRDQYDKRAREHHYKPGERVMVYMPQEKTGKKRKLGLPYHGPYRVLEVHPNGLSVRPVDKPEENPILVNVDHVTSYPGELADESWLGNRTRRPPRKARKQRQGMTAASATKYNL